MDLLKRSLAPITAAGWKAIDEYAARTLKGYLSARKLVDFKGPGGWETAAVNLGRLELAPAAVNEGIFYGLRRVQPLVEARVPFVLDMMELDSASRGAQDIDLLPLQKAAEKIALFEENAVYNGSKPAGIEGLLPAGAHKPIPLPAEGARFPALVAKAVETLLMAGVGGPFALVLGSEAYQELLSSTDGGYPVRGHVQDITQGPILWSPALEGGVLLSTRGGDFELSVGQDFSIGYVGHDRHTVELFMAGSFTFRVIEPLALVALPHKRKSA